MNTNNINTTAGTAGGTFLTLLGMMDANDFLRTILLAVVGATVSFLASVLLRKISRFNKRQ